MFSLVVKCKNIKIKCLHTKTLTKVCTWLEESRFNKNKHHLKHINYNIKRISFYYNNLLHRSDGGPALICFGGGHGGGGHGAVSLDYYVHGVQHNLQKPSHLYYYNGLKCYEHWFINNKPGRLANLPSKIYYTAEGDIETVYFYSSDVLLKYYKKNILKEEVWRCPITGHFHRNEDKPSFISYHDNGRVHEEIWYIFGSLCRANGPYYIRTNERGVIIETTFNKK